MSVKPLLVALVVAYGLTSGAVRADDRYYLMMFAAQAEPNVPQSSHTFALFAKVAGDKANPQIQTLPISWMPAEGEIEPLRRDPVPGKNFSIEESIRWAQSVNARVSMWGPFPIKKDLWDMAVAQAEKLNSGKVQYLMLDTKLRGKGASNCIHAIADMDGSQPAINTGVARGDEATKMVLSFFDPYVLPGRASNRWLVDRLGIDPRIVNFVNPDVTATK